MDKLSIEILSLIIAELSAAPSPRPADRPRLAAYATISRTWQHLIEPRTFAAIRYLRLDEEELSTFASLFKHRRRQTLLRNLYLSFEPPFEGNLRAGHIANSTALGSALTSLFKFLSTWEVDCRTIDILFHIAWANYTPNRRYFMLDQPETVLAAVPYVSYLGIEGICGCALHPTAAVKLASSLPNLRTLDYKFYSPDNKRAQLRKEIRRALATSLNSLELPMLQQLELAQNKLFLNNHSFEYGDDRDADGVDPLNTSVHNFSQRTPIQRLVLNDFLVSSDLFKGQDPESTWPTLQQFDIAGGPVAPSGKWYCTGDPTAASPPGSTRGYGSDASQSEYPSSDSDISWHRNLDDSGTDDDDDRDAIRNGDKPDFEWRKEPDWDMLTPLLVDMARAVQRMPNLQIGSLHLDLGISIVRVQCAAPGFRYAHFDKYELRNFRTCRFFVGETRHRASWYSLEQVPEEVRSAWREWLGSDGEMETGAYWINWDRVF
ncbi:hypothetical protein CONLIGDRAFT_632206 [Coniochaeta ligniaria NRRL 30616]|uniref:F-box domain-containing protein n=1 Tax=Coniochaeta ligniaria NRRL 30616 TaxID=1408157 RepID=A0A1J7JJU3_9PEZI|nr:hypothetical protein CONLIGDRAFT_632206 [Coniochaeta ligniaria NRRL 30616]